MTCFADSSALLAVLDRDDENHERAKAVWLEFLRQRVTLVTSSYALVETMAILQHRLGMDAVRVFHNDIYPILTIEWVTKPLHEKGIGVVLAAGRRNLSLVDCVSFDVMRQRGIRRVFSFDRHFREQGFDLVP